MFNGLIREIGEVVDFENEVISIKSNLAPNIGAVSYTHLTLPTTIGWCRSRWSPYH